MNTQTLKELTGAPQVLTTHSLWQKALLVLTDNFGAPCIYIFGDTTMYKK